MELASAYEAGTEGAWSETHAHDEALSDVIYESAARAYMAGQLFVRDIEMGRGEVQLQDDPPPFLGMVFEEALERFAARGIVTPEVFYSDIAGIRQRSFTATRLMTQQLRERAHRELTRILEEGGTVRDFVEAIRAGEITLGLDPSTEGYLSNVFHTNVASAYGAGRFEQMTHPDVIRERPFVQYRAIMDSATREAHAELHETIYEADSDEWHAIAPPNGFNCRCSMVTLSAEQVGDRAVSGAPDLSGIDFAEAPTAPLDVEDT